jgi:hypothetical protein
MPVAVKPMDIAFQLLKEEEEDEEEDEIDFGRFHDPNYRYEQTYGDLRNNQTVPMKDARFGPMGELDQRRTEEKRNIIDNVDRLQHKNFDETFLTEVFDARPHGDMSNEELRERLATVPPYVRDARGRVIPVPWSDGGQTSHVRFHPNSGPQRWALEQEMKLRELESQPTMFYEINPFTEEFQDLYRSEPMNIALQLLKERKSPEAMRHKLEYDKQYEKTPERRNYQRELHAERRKRGIYGTGDHMDVSHTQGGRLTLEPEHANRARHFKDRGTLRVV